MGDGALKRISARFAPLADEGLSPDVSVLGYAIYLTINALSLWGGVFPFFPMEFHTVQVTFMFALAQSVAHFVTFASAIAIACYYPTILRKALALGCSLSVAFGACCLIGALYIESWKLQLVVAGGVLLGAGSAGFALSFQRYFASLEAAEGNFKLILGTGLAPCVFLALYAVPIAVTVYLVPLVLVPVCGLCVLLATRRIDFKQPQFSDVPRDHPKVYARVAHDYWRPAVAIGSLGFVSGVVRAASLSDVSMGDVTNIASMVGLFVVAALMFVLWWRRGFALDIRVAFLILFPLVAMSMVVFPFVDMYKMFYVAGFSYALFVLACVIMLLQCAQVARDRGVNPVFVYGFFGAIVYLLQNIGLLFGLVSFTTEALASEDGYVVALISLFVLSMALFCLRGDIRLSYVDKVRTESVEFMPLGPAADSSLPSRRLLEISLDDGRPPSVERGLSGGGETADDAYALEFERRCARIRERYRLTKRETEIMQMLIRGNTVSRIAEALFVSENTVRTHTKHIYTKLDVHKRQEVLDLFERS